MPLQFICTILESRTLLKRSNLNNIHCVSRFASHYETLQLKRNSTQKEIRESFLDLSKKHHPDVDNNKESHERFLKINEAYNVLSKPQSRRLYDLGLLNESYVEIKYRTGGKGRSRVVYGQKTGRNPWDDPAFYHNRDKSQDQFYQKAPYYGIRGVNKMSNSAIAFICILFTVLVVALQALAIRSSVTFNREKLIEQSKQANEIWAKVKEDARNSGAEAQIEIYRKHFEQIKNDKP